MVVGYNCTDPRDGCTGGYKNDCDVTESGERVCPDCGMAVLGITERHDVKTHRTPYTTFRVDFGPIGNRSVLVSASTYEGAFDQAEGKFNEKVITRVTPVN